MLRYLMIVGLMAMVWERFREFHGVARLNGYAVGNGSRAQLARDLQRLGLSPKGQDYLMDLVRASGR
jgi:hypothetical protein